MSSYVPWFPKPQVPQPSRGDGSRAPELREKPESRVQSSGQVQVSIRLVEAISPLWGVRALRAWYE